MAGKIRKLLFVDTNIWLDFYRTRSDAGLALLRDAEAVSDRIIVTYQLESEFKKNRQTAILEGMQELKAPLQIPRPGLFSDVKATEIMNRNVKQAERRVKDLKAKFIRALENPATCDPVYQACQRIFHKDDSLVLSREKKIRLTIRRKAFRRFLHGCPPRKRSDTSIGDAFNWEWIIYCAVEHNAEVVIVSRDADFGIIIDSKSYINDHLRQEFGERVSKKRRVILHNRLSEALKQFEIPISKQVEDAEKEVADVSTQSQAAALQRLGSLPSRNEYADALRALQVTDYLGALKDSQANYADMLKGLQANDYFDALKSLQVNYADIMKGLQANYYFDALKGLQVTYADMLKGLQVNYADMLKGLQSQPGRSSDSVAESPQNSPEPPSPKPPEEES